ncbi:MAG: FIST C-terminal domain-containing protein [Defluviitaleaceae bacterium]|nr:FIST C-terminal domain-containing protein [Defluviitaleaceae bacterium]
MSIRTCSSINATAAGAVAEIKEKLIGFDIKMAVFFASWEKYDPCEISAGMHSAFPHAVVYGGSSHAEIHNGRTLVGSLTVMAFDTETIADAKVEVLENISGGINPDAAFASFDAYFATPMSTADYQKYGGIILIDGLSIMEERVMNEIGNHTNIMFTGGSASDALKFEKTYIYANGKAYADAALLAVFKTVRGIDYIKTQSVDILDTVLTATKVDAEKRTVIEFDGQPAAVRYAEALGVARSELEPHLFFNPVGLVIDNDVYVRSCYKNDGDALVFFCTIYEDTQVNLLKIKDIIPDTKKAVAEKRAELGEIAGIIDFKCVLRSLQLANENKTDAYAEIFEGIPSIGFSTYGEQLLGHINQTSTMIVFK